MSGFIIPTKEDMDEKEHQIFNMDVSKLPPQPWPSYPHSAPSPVPDSSTLAGMLTELEATLHTPALRDNLDRILLALHDNPEQAQNLLDPQINLIVEACGRARDSVMANKTEKKTKTTKKKMGYEEADAMFSQLKF